MNNCITLIWWKPSLFNRDGACGDNSKTQRFSVKKFVEVFCAFNCVTNRVTEIKNSALTRLVPLIFRHDFGFDLDIALDQPL